MELPNSNGYLLFFQKRAGWFVRVKSARWRRSWPPSAHVHFLLTLRVETRATMKRWFKIHDHVNINLQISLVAIYRGSLSVSKVPLADLKSGLEVFGRRVRQSFSHFVSDIFGKYHEKRWSYPAKCKTVLPAWVEIFTYINHLESFTLGKSFAKYSSSCIVPQFSISKRWGK